MTSLPTSLISEKFLTCTNSQTGIETVSKWVIFHRDSAETIVNVWTSQCKRIPRNKILIFFNIANDVIQNDRKDAPVYRGFFFKAFRHLFRGGLILKCDEHTQQSIQRILKILKDRHYFSHQQFDELKSAIEASVCNTSSLICYLQQSRLCFFFYIYYRKLILFHHLVHRHHQYQIILLIHL